MTEPRDTQPRDKGETTSHSGEGAGAEQSGPFTRGEGAASPGMAGMLSTNLAQRLMAGVPALAALLALVALGPPMLIGVVVAVAGVWGLVEYLRLFETGITDDSLKTGRRPVVPLAIAAALLGLGGLTGSPLVLHGALTAAAISNVVCCLFREEGGRGLPNTGIAMTGLVLVPWMINHLALIAWLPEGRALLLFLILTLTLNDTLAYAVGVSIGRRPLLPQVSPKKTVEGSMGGLVGGIAAGLIAALFWPGEGQGFWALGGFGAMAVLGALLAYAGQAGDLMESKLKRINNVKESGLFLPGHGGILDRLDAYLLAGPALYYLARGWMWLSASV